MNLKKVVAIYLSVISESFMAVIKAWRQVLIQIPLLLLFGLIAPLAGLFGFVGGLILGLLSALVVSYYLVLVRSVVLNEKFSLDLVKQEGMMLFYPALSLFFTLFLVNLALGVVQAPFVNLAVGILITVLLNPIVEFLYLEESTLGELVELSFDFISRHFLVWFIPIFICISPLAIKQPGLILMIFSQDPLSLLSLFVGYVSSLFRVLALEASSVPIIITILYLSFFIMVFRGKLILKLK